VLYDDRDESPGIKFNDADLIGIPLQVIIGNKNLQNSEVEIKVRATGEKFKIQLDSLNSKLQELISEMTA
jgi:prolyl-tRNA synthetase